MQVTMEALLAELLAVMGDFHCHPRVVRIFRRSCRITPQSNSPMPVLPTMQSDDVRQENMATVNIPLKYCWKSCKRKQFIHSTIAELQVSMAVYSCIQTRLMTTSDRSQCPELISNYEFNDHWPRVKFVYYVNKYLLVPSFKLETAEIIRNSVTKDAFFYVPTHQDFQHLLQVNVHWQTYHFKALATPLQYHASSKEANLILQSHGIGVHHIPGPLVVKFT